MVSDPLGLTPCSAFGTALNLVEPYMPRPLRNDYEGAWHHVMNRAAGGANIFAADSDKCLFLDCLAEGSGRYDIAVHCYCLMSNHFHLLACSGSAKLSDAMRFIVGKFTRAKNSRDRRDGPLFRGRFKSVGIETDAHLVLASRYIHLNPVEAGLVTEAGAWPWSSAGAYLGATAKPDWLQTSSILELFGPSGAVMKYREFLGAGVDPKTRWFYAETSC